MRIFLSYLLVAVLGNGVGNQPRMDIDSTQEVGV